MNKGNEKMYKDGDLKGTRIKVAKTFKDAEEMRREILEKIDKINIILNDDKIKSKDFGRLKIGFLIEEIRTCSKGYDKKFYIDVIFHLDSILEILGKKEKMLYSDEYELEFLLKGFQTERVKNEINVKRYSDTNKRLLYDMISEFKKENEYKKE